MLIVCDTSHKYLQAEISVYIMVDGEMTNIEFSQTPGVFCHDIKLYSRYRNDEQVELRGNYRITNFGKNLRVKVTTDGVFNGKYDKMTFTRCTIDELPDYWPDMDFLAANQRPILHPVVADTD